MWLIPLTCAIKGPRARALDFGVDVTHATDNPLDLRAYAKIFWRWKYLFLACIVLLPTAAYLLSARNPKVYKASVTLQVQASAVDTSLEVGFIQPPTGDQEIVTAARLVRTTAVAREAARHMQSASPGPRALMDAIKATPETTAGQATEGLVTIEASASSGRRAADIANAFADAVVVRRARDARTRLDKAIEQLTRQVKGSGRDPTARRQLSQQIQQLRALRAAQGNNAKVIEPAHPSRAAVSPRPVRTATLALVVAILVGLGLVLAAQNLDRRVRRAEDLENLTGRPLLGTVSKTAFAGDVGAREQGHVFEMLGASLRYFNIDRALSSILVTSPLQGDGKTTVATNLALALARTGKDVIIVDADLRRPRVGERLGVPLGAGLGDVLVESFTLEDALFDYEVDSSRGRLRVLPAGSPPPNPAELLASAQMEHLVERLVELSSVVIVDTTPALAVSDTIPLYRDVSGIVMVARLNGTRRDAIGRLQRIIDASGAKLLGVVATGTPDTGLYGYGYGYGDESKSGSRFGRRKDNGKPPALRPEAKLVGQISPEPPD